MHAALPYAPGREQEAKRVPVSLPPMARALQEFVDALPHGPLPQGMPGPSPDDMINLLNQMMIPPQFYTPPSTMRVVSSKPAGSSGGHGRQGGRSGKRGKRDDDDVLALCFPLPQALAHHICPACACCVLTCCVAVRGACVDGFAAATRRHVPAAAEAALCQHHRLAAQRQPTQHERE